MCYSAQPWDQIFVKGYDFLFSAKNIGKNINKNWVVNIVTICNRSLKLL